MWVIVTNFQHPIRLIQRLSLVILIALLSCFFFIGCANLFSQNSSNNNEIADIHLRLGTTYLEQGQNSHALKQLLRASELAPDNPLIQNNLGLTYFVFEKYDLAEKHLKNATSLKPEYTEARNNLSRVLIEEKKYPQAQKELELVLNDLTYHNRDKAFVNLGMIHFVQQNFNVAITNFQLALKLNPNYCLAHNYLGRSFYELKEYKKSAEIFDHAVKFCQKLQFDEPQYFGALSYLNLGQTLQAQNRFKELLVKYPTGRYVNETQAKLNQLTKVK